MKHVRYFALAALACACLLLCACVAEEGLLLPKETPAPTFTPLPTPTPTPLPAVAVWSDSEDSAFLEGVAAAAADGARTVAISGGMEALTAAFPFEGRSAALCCLTDPEPDFAPLLALAKQGVPVLCYAAAGQSVPEPLLSLRYDASGAAEAAMEALLAFPPHDTPVRVFGLFSAREGEAFRVFSEYRDAGKLLVKGVYAESDSESEPLDKVLEGWMKKTYPGMADAFYAGSPALAARAAEALAALERTDVEIFCAGANGALLTAMRDMPALLVYAAGENPYYAGRLCREYAGLLCAGETVESGVVYPRAFTPAQLTEGLTALTAG